MLKTLENFRFILGREEVYEASPRVWSFKYSTDSIGEWRGQNNMGKVLMICRQVIIDGVEPIIDYDLLRDAQIHIFGKPFQFN